MADSRRLERTATPGIYKRGHRYVIVWQHRGRQHKEFHSTLAEARAAKGRRGGGDRRKIPRVRFADYAERWIETYRGRTSRGFQETTRIEYRRDLEHRLLPYFGTWRLDEIEASDVKAWLGWLEETGGSPSAIRKAKATLSALLADALEDGKLRFNPALGVRYVPREPLAARPKPRGLTVAELERLMAELAPEWRLLIALLAHTGLRISEALGLRWEHVHLGDDPQVDVREQVYRGRRKLQPKSHHGYRSLPLSPGMAVALSRHLQGAERTLQGAERTRPEDPVFCSSTGSPLDYSALRPRVLVPAIEASGIDWPEGIAFHMLRRTAASLLHDTGKSGRQLSDWLGHHDPAFTLRTYVGQVDAGLGDASFFDELCPVPDAPPAPTRPMTLGQRPPGHDSCPGPEASATAETEASSVGQPHQQAGRSTPGQGIGATESLEMERPAA